MTNYQNLGYVFLTAVASWDHLFLKEFIGIIKTLVYLCVCPTGRMVSNRSGTQESQIRKQFRWQPINGAWRTCNAFLKTMNRQWSIKRTCWSSPDSILDGVIFHISVGKESRSHVSSTELISLIWFRMICRLHVYNRYSLKNKNVHTLVVTSTVYFCNEWTWFS